VGLQLRVNQGSRLINVPSSLLLRSEWDLGIPCTKLCCWCVFVAWVSQHPAQGRDISCAQQEQVVLLSLCRVLREGDREAGLQWRESGKGKICVCQEMQCDLMSTASLRLYPSYVQQLWWS